MFLKKSVLRIYSKFSGEQPCQSAISIKLLCKFIEIALRYPVNFSDHVFLENASSFYYLFSRLNFQIN